MSPASAGHDPDDAGEAFASDFDDAEPEDAPPLDEPLEVEPEEPEPDPEDDDVPDPFFSAARESVR